MGQDTTSHTLKSTLPKETAPHLPFIFFKADFPGRLEKLVTWVPACMHGHDSPVQNKSLPAHPGYIFISQFFAISNSFHSCIYIQIFFSSDLKLKMLQSCIGQQNKAPSSAQSRGCNFIPKIRLLPLNRAFVFYGINRNISLNCRLVFGYRQHSLLSCFSQNGFSGHIPSTQGEKPGQGWKRGERLSFLFLQSQRQCYLVPQIPFQQRQHSIHTPIEYIAGQRWLSQGAMG